MLSIFKKFFDYNEKELKRLEKKVNQINSLEDKARALKEEQFKKETAKLKEEIKSGNKSLDDILPWAFAIVREVARRSLGERHFDVQLMAAIALHEGKAVEQKTGEGKTLSATAPLYLNALEGKGAHLVTVNDYLARRDVGWMGQIYHQLGLTVSSIVADKSYIFDPEYTDKETTDWRLQHLREISRAEAYQADITYGVNSEFGFDYLRDNMAYSANDLVQRGFHYAIIDEVDSVLIDEARTPHIISAPYEQDTSKYHQYAKMVERLNPDTDYLIDEKSRTAHLTEKGILKLEKMSGIENIYEKDFETLFHVEAALKAKTLFKIDKDYIVKDSQVVIVDEFTGRLLLGRRFSEGIHQAIEAKENVAIKRESRTLATVSLQNYFRMYDKLAGMTGTAATEAEEFHKIYNLNVVVVPTDKPMVRKDHPDLIYKTERGKFSAVVEEIAKNYKKGRPVLVGTTSIEKNEILSSFLKKKGVPHELLNAKNHEREALIIANAGKKGAITVATNMAGRGVDIILGGQPPSKYEISRLPSPGGEATGGQANLKNKKLEEEFNKKMKKWRASHQEIVSLGGLYVVGTERHESRRIDNQLRGRTGRQGDPGQSRIFVSLEDDLMRIFGGEQVSKLMTFFKIPENQPLEHAMVTKAMEQAQVKVEGFNFDIRKHLVDFDDVLNKQREIVYRMRKQILEAASKENYNQFEELILERFNEQVTHLINFHLVTPETPDLDKLTSEFVMMVPIDKNKLLAELEKKDKDKIEKFLKGEIKLYFEKKEKEFGPRLWIEIGKQIFLTTVDKYWTEHLTAVDDLREGIGLRGYAQLDPLIEYKNEAFSMFEKLISDIDFEATRRILKVELKREEVKVAPLFEAEKLDYKKASRVDPFSVQAQKKTAADISSPPTHLTTSQGEPAGLKVQPAEGQTGFKVTPPGTEKRKIGRNDPCPCGSGKKYKKCHYPQYE